MKLKGNKIRKMRCDRDMSQLELASKLGYKYGNGSISQIEAGDSMPAADVLIKLSIIFGVNPKELIEFEEGEIKPGYVEEKKTRKEKFIDKFKAFMEHNDRRPTIEEVNNHPQFRGYNYHWVTDHTHGLKTIASKIKKGLV